ncbi:MULTISPECIES: signal peptidase II [unclassified Paenibacillus]|uniref:signal peptidase II n=1 Tax=unclassified Paenibacillus TaxID=185978 RepID=UPI00020D72ED|nr:MULTISPECIES: signal peptidase II [unclassified Paenibacillus]EGL15576.1 signal peptidase II [Paenibacillus sp. HGF7]EPD88261.1 signal peptidase II [Paenibacillus sp. HGH0039]
MLFYFTAALVAAVDQFAKALIRATMAVGESVPFWGSMALTHYENSGMAGSRFQGYARVFAVLAVVFIAIVLYYRRKGEIQGPLMDASMGFLTGGAAGNAIDRFWFGKVTDFLEFRPGGGILNLADIAINIGVVLFLIAGVLDYYRKKQNPLAAGEEQG